MSGTVSDLIRREEKLNNFKRAAIETPEMQIDHIIEMYYGPTDRIKHDTLISLRRIGYMARKHPHRVK